jgi:hypothetical protein
MRIECVVCFAAARVILGWHNRFVNQPATAKESTGLVVAAAYRLSHAV